MPFTEAQVRALNRPVPSRDIKSRVSDGRELSYIEGWFALSQANRIFGFDCWDRETIETKCVLSREVRGVWTAVYFARVKITVRTQGSSIVRDGHGTGDAQAGTAGEVHDRALKAAETDATKRALATFGKAFGLALYSAQYRDSARVVGSSRGAVNVEIKPVDTLSSGSTESPSKTAHKSAPLGEADRLVENSNGIRSRSLGAVGTFLPKARIDKSTLTLGEPQRVRDKDHLRYVAAQPCTLCSTTPSDAHHVRFAQPRAMGRKVGDDFTVPLCRNHHIELHHSGNEAAWWHDMGIDPLEIAKQLRIESEQRRA